MNQVRRKRTQRVNGFSHKTAQLQNDPARVEFYRANEKPYGAFSNLFRRSIEFEGIIYPTAEHAYQAGKAIKPSVRDWILAAPTPALAAMAAHGLYSWEVVPNWAEIKFDRMRRVLRAKFSQHSDLAQLLISTGAARIVEAGTVNNAVNRLWGEVNGNGQNMLGMMLMELRGELVAKEKGRTLRSVPAKKKQKSSKQKTVKRPARSKRRAKLR